MQILVLRSVNQSVLAFPSCYKCKSTSQNFMSGPILTAAPRTFKTNLWFSNNLTEFQNTSSQFHVPDYSTLKHKGSNFCPPRIPKRVNQLNLSIFARRVSPNRGASCPLTRQKLGKSDTDNQSHWALPASCPNLFIAAELYISQLYIWTLYIWKQLYVHTRQLYTLGNYTSEPSIVGSRRFDKKCCKYLQLTNSRRRRPNLILFPGKFSPQPEIEDGRAAKYKRANFTNIIFDTNSKALKPLLPIQMCCSLWK